MEWMSAGSDYLSDRAFREGFMSPLSNFFKEKLTEFGKAGAKITGFFFAFVFFYTKDLCQRLSAASPPIRPRSSASSGARPSYRGLRQSSGPC